jgi:hypothetical protein
MRGFQPNGPVRDGCPLAAESPASVSEQQPSLEMPNDFCVCASLHFRGIHLRITYTLGRTQERLEYIVSLFATEPHFGGRRWWFGCPQCRRRAQKLFLPPCAIRFGCRECYSLSYSSRTETRLGRTRERARDIGIRLGGSRSLLDPFPDKPKGMWWKTYHGLLDECGHYNRASWRLLTERVDRFRQRSPDRAVCPLRIMPSPPFVRTSASVQILDVSVQTKSFRTQFVES